MNRRGFIQTLSALGASWAILPIPEIAQALDRSSKLSDFQIRSLDCDYFCINPAQCVKVENSVGEVVAIAMTEPSIVDAHVRTDIRLQPGEVVDLNHLNKYFVKRLLVLAVEKGQDLNWYNIKGIHA